MGRWGDKVMGRQGDKEMGGMGRWGEFKSKKSKFITSYSLFTTHSFKPIQILALLDKSFYFHDWDDSILSMQIAVLVIVFPIVQ